MTPTSRAQRIATAGLVVVAAIVVAFPVLILLQAAYFNATESPVRPGDALACFALALLPVAAVVVSVFRSRRRNAEPRSTVLVASATAMASGFFLMCTIMVLSAPF